MNSFVFLNDKFIEICYKHFEGMVLEEELQKYIESMMYSLKICSTSGDESFVQGISDADIFSIVGKILKFNAENLLESMKAGQCGVAKTDPQINGKINRLKLTYDALQGVLDNCAGDYQGVFATDILMWLLVNIKCYLDNNKEDEMCCTTYKVIPAHQESKYERLSLDLGIRGYESYMNDNEEWHDEVTATLFMDNIKKKLFEGNNPTKSLALFGNQEEERFINGIKNSRTKTDFFDIFELFPSEFDAEYLLDSFMIEQWTNVIDAFFVNQKELLSEKDEIVGSPRLQYFCNAGNGLSEEYIFPVYSKDMIYDVVERLNQEALISDWDCYHLELDGVTGELVKKLDDYSGERRIYYNHLQYAVINDFYYSVSECSFFSLFFVCSLLVFSGKTTILPLEKTETVYVKVLAKMEEILTELLRKNKEVISRSHLINEIHNTIKAKDYSRYKGYWEMEQGIRNEKKRVRMLREEEKRKYNKLEKEEDIKCLENLLSRAVFW